MLFPHDADVTRFRGQPVTMRGSVYVTLFTAPRSWQQDVPAVPESVVEGVRCAQFVRGFITCRALLDSSNGKLSIRPLGAERDLWTMGTSSYAPLPPLDLRPYRELSTTGFVLGSILPPQSERQLQPNTFEFRYTEPVSHFWLNFEIPIERFLE